MMNRHTRRAILAGAVAAGLITNVQAHTAIWVPKAPAIIKPAEFWKPYERKLIKDPIPVTGLAMPIPIGMFKPAAGGGGGIGGNDSFTKILLHMDGTDTSTTFTDTNAGGSAHTWTANGNAQVDTAITKFGTGALLCDGTGDYLNTVDHADFTLGTSDFTIDCWFNVAGGQATIRHLYGQNSSATLSTFSFTAQISAANVMSAIAVTGSTQITCTGTTAFTTAGWHHFAHVRSGSNFFLFIDGVQEATTTDASAINDSTGDLCIGRRGVTTTNTWFGSIDEFRLSVGTARWTSNFTPPLAAYS